MLYYKTELEDYIEMIFHHLNISNPDELQMNEIAQKLNIIIFHYPMISRAIRAEGQLIINLNSGLDPQEQWQTFGHELHHILKETGNQAFIPVPLREMRENKANNFALHFCVPTFMLDRLKWPDRCAYEFVAETFHVTLPFAQKRIDQYRCRIIQCQLDYENAKFNMFV